MRKHSAAKSIFLWCLAIGGAALAVLFPRGTSNAEDLPVFFRVYLPVVLLSIAAVAGLVWVVQSVADRVAARKRPRSPFRR